MSIVARVAGLRHAVVDGRILRAPCEHGASAVPPVIAALDGDGIAVASVTVARPSLDDVYLRHTGRSYSSNEPGGFPMTAIAQTISITSATCGCSCASRGSCS